MSDGHLTTSLAGVHALLVDDEPDSLDVVETVLRYCGAVVTTAATAKEAVARLGVRELPHCAAIPVVALTAHIGLDDRIEQAGSRRAPSSPSTRGCAELQRVPPSAGTPGARRLFPIGTYRSTQNPWASMPRATLNLLRKFSSATAAVSSTTCASA